MKTIKWGLLATGQIAGQMAQAISAADDGVIAAVASRSRDKAEAFGDKWNIPKRYPNYAQLAADPELDVIYIATPHSHHFENLMTCLHAGKHVLCEKPLTLNAQQAEECIKLARSKGVFLMEAVWTRCTPALLQVKRWLDEGVIGDVRLITAQFCVDVPFDPAHRMYAPELGGGALLDLGIYPLTVTTFLLGLPDSFTASAQLNPHTGVDEAVAMVLRYDNGALAQLSASSCTALPVEAVITGSKGSIRIHDRMICPHQLTLHINGKEPVTHQVPYRSNGYLHEVEEVQNCIRAGKTESTRMPLDETLATMKIMDAMRYGWGFRYPHEIAGRLLSS